MNGNADMSIVRLANYIKIWDIIRNYGQTSIPSVSKKTELSLPTVTRAVEYGIQVGLIVCGDIVGGERGRKAQEYKINSDYMHFAEISIHNRSLFYSVEDLSFNQLKKGTVDIDNGNLLRKIDDLCLDLVNEDGFIQIIGISFSGTVNYGTVYESYDFPSMNGVNLKSHLEDLTDVCVFVENNLRTALFGASKSIQKISERTVVALLFGRKGYGSATMVRGKLLYGSTGEAGRLTNLVVTVEDRNSNEIYSEFLRSLIALFDPDTVVLYPNGDNADRDKVVELAVTNMGNQVIPSFVDGRDFTEDVFLGLSHKCDSIFHKIITKELF